MIRGIGPVYAKKMVRAFGEKVFDVPEPNFSPLAATCPMPSRPSFDLASNTARHC